MKRASPPRLQCIGAVHNWVAAHFSRTFVVRQLPHHPICRVRRVRRVIATSTPGYPCRVSLADAGVGEELLLLSFEHQPANSPYRSSGPIFVRQAAVEARIQPGVIPAVVRSRLMSVRAYDREHLMTDAIVCEGGDTASVIRRMFGAEKVAYIHLHNAHRGCFSCAVRRV